jgi:hypothetical protein
MGRLVPTHDFGVGVAARLDIARELDRLPPASIAVAAVLRRAVRAFARVLVQQLPELRVGIEPAFLLGPVDSREVRAQRRDPVAILLLPPDDRAVELALGADFLAVGPEEQDRRLDALPELKQLLYEHACEGAYGAPEYGGNRDGRGWAAISFPGDVQPRGFTDAEVAGRE